MWKQSSSHRETDGQIETDRWTERRTMTGRERDTQAEKLKDGQPGRERETVDRESGRQTGPSSYRHYTPLCLKRTDLTVSPATRLPELPVHTCLRTNSRWKKKRWRISGRSYRQRWKCDVGFNCTGSYIKSHDSPSFIHFSSDCLSLYLSLSFSSTRLSPCLFDLSHHSVCVLVQTQLSSGLRPAAKSDADSGMLLLLGDRGRAALQQPCSNEEVCPC